MLGTYVCVCVRVMGWCACLAGFMAAHNGNKVRITRKAEQQQQKQLIEWLFVRVVPSQSATAPASER